MLGSGGVSLTLVLSPPGPKPAGIPTPTLQPRTQKHEEVQSDAHGHQASKWQCWHLNPAPSDVRVHALASSSQVQTQGFSTSPFPPSSCFFTPKTGLGLRSSTPPCLHPTNSRFSFKAQFKRGPSVRPSQKRVADWVAECLSAAGLKRGRGSEAPLRRHLPSASCRCRVGVRDTTSFGFQNPERRLEDSDL